MRGLGAAHVLDDGDEVAGAHVAAAEAGGAAAKPRHVRDRRIARGLRHGVGEGRLDLAQLRVRLHHRNIQPLDHRDRLHMAQRPDDILGRERPEAGDVQQADLDSAVLADPIDGGLGGLHHAAGADDGVLGVVAGGTA